MKMMLYTRIVVEEPDGYKSARIGKILVPDLNRLTDEMCERALEEIAAKTLRQYPAGSLVKQKEFISKSGYDALSDIADVTTEKGGQGRLAYTIYMKATGLFADPENVHGFGPGGPDIPFYLHASKPFEKLREDDKRKLQEKALVLCGTRFGRTPARIVFIAEEEYDLLVNKIRDAGQTKENGR